MELKIAMKGASEPLSFNIEEIDAGEYFHAIHSHINEYGFRGWRVIRGLILNMGEVQAFWITGQAPDEFEPVARAAAQEKGGG